MIWIFKLFTSFLIVSPLFGVGPDIPPEGSTEFEEGPPPEPDTNYRAPDTSNEDNLTMNAESTLACNLDIPKGEQCSYYAFYDERDGLVYIIKDSAKAQGYTPGFGYISRSEIASTAHQTVNVREQFPDKIETLSRVIVFFTKNENVLYLQLKAIYIGDTDWSRKLIKIN